jgi:L-ascorbate metabolism protein UlaG (beta-lactamase superfamily)
LLRWHVQRLRQGVAPDPAPHELPIVASDVAYPGAAPDEIRATWVGHSTFLLQLGGWNVLTDPVWSHRVSPIAWAGPARLTPPGLHFDRLPRIDVVVLSHDHFDHLDRPTVERLHGRFGRDLRWITPLGYGAWFDALGIGPVIELDWWQRVSLRHAVADDAPAMLEIVAAPARHWTRRSMFTDADRLWASFGLFAGDGARVYFAGDSGYFEEYADIGRRLGPFDLSLIPIGAYEPRWFMQAAHMNPEEAVRTYQDVGGQGVFGGMHWGTFRLADEPPLEPPVRTRAAWRDAGLDDANLWIPAHGDTRIVHVGTGRNAIARIAALDPAGAPAAADVLPPRAAAAAGPADPNGAGGTRPPGADDP